MKKYIEKVKMAYRKFSEKCHVTWLKFKHWCKIQVIKFEKKRGLGMRCEWCSENIFCEMYGGAPVRKHFWEKPQRCTDAHSTR